MKIFSAAQIRQWDQYTISNTGYTSADLMERAANACTNWLMEHITYSKKIIIFCGTGNNGGDGLAMARLLHHQQRQIEVHILNAPKRSAGFDLYLQKLYDLGIPVHEIDDNNSFPEIPAGSIVVEALFGTGLNKPLEGTAEMLVQYINRSEAEVISIDMPAGLFADESSAGNTVIKATHTLSFQCYKLALLLAENGEFTGCVHILYIGLHPQYKTEAETDSYTIDKAMLQSFFKNRKQYTHKYSYGHALLYAGSKNMMGAAVLCANACLRSGAGLVTVHTSEELFPILHTALPEAIADAGKDFSVSAHKKAAIGIGPGLAVSESNAALLKQTIITWKGPLVIDASALTMLQTLLPLLAERNYPVILTPHTGEFERLFGKCNNDFDRMHKALEKAALHHCYVVLKSNHTLVACPDGEAYFNTTGNSGMATAGSGDVLTGILTSLLAQGYEPKEACLLGVYLHGLAGDHAANELSEEAMIASDIIQQLGNAFRTFNRSR